MPASDNYLALAVVFLAASALVGVVAWSQGNNVARVYGATALALSDGSGTEEPLNTAFVWGTDPINGIPAVIGTPSLPTTNPDYIEPVEARPMPGSKYLIQLGRDGVSEVRRSVMDTYIWAAVILAVGVFFAMRK